MVSVEAMPAARASAAVTSGLEVSSTAGVLGTSGSARIRRDSSRPSMPGMHMSSTARLYGVPAAARAVSRASADSPSLDGVDLDAPGAELLAEHEAVGRVVVDREHPQPGEVGAAVARGGRVLRRLERQR